MCTGIHNLMEIHTVNDAGRKHMGPYDQNMDRLILIAVVAIAVGLATPPYSKVVAKLAASGVELTWLGHIGVFTLVMAAGLAALALVWALFLAVGWVIERARR